MWTEQRGIEMSDTSTIDLTPSDAGYANLLREIIRSTTSKQDWEWATMELKKVYDNGGV